MRKGKTNFPHGPEDKLQRLESLLYLIKLMRELKRKRLAIAKILPEYDSTREEYEWLMIAMSALDNQIETLASECQRESEKMDM